MSFQANGLQFDVTGSLDGVTRNPLFSVDPGSPDYKQPDAATNLYQFRLQNLGILDLSLVPVVPSMGIRFVRSLWIIGEPSPVTGGVVELVDSVSLKFMRVIAMASSPSTSLFVGRTIRVPQGASLRLSGWQATPGTALRVRVEVRPATSTRQWAEQLIASCCQSATRQANIPTPPVPQPPIEV